MKIQNFLIISVISISVISCAHHKDVRPGVEGVHSVRVQSDMPKEGVREAIEQSQYFCEKRNMEAAFIDEDQKYIGIWMKNHIGPFVK